MTEDELERAIVSYLDATLTKLHSCLHLAKGNSLTGFWGGKASPALMRAGAPRLAIVGVGKIYLIFTHTLGDDLSELEQEFKAWCATHDTPYCVARSIDDVRVALEYWKIPLRPATHAGTES